MIKATAFLILLIVSVVLRNRFVAMGKPCCEGRDLCKPTKQNHSDIVTEPNESRRITRQRFNALCNMPAMPPGTTLDSPCQPCSPVNRLLPYDDLKKTIEDNLVCCECSEQKHNTELQDDLLNILSFARKL